MNLFGQSILRTTSGRFGGFPQSIKPILQRLKPCFAQDQFLQQIVMGAAMASALITGFPGNAPAQTETKEQCSAAVVSRLLGSNAPDCDLSMVRSRAKDGHLFEQNQMGIRSILAIAPDYDGKEALQWFQRAALRGYAPAQVNLAVMYINGWGTPVNYGAGLHWLQTAAHQHFARAYYNLGILYLGGKGVRQDNAEAFQWFEKGAQAGDSSAQTNLGYMYDLGLGCARNVKTAAEWYGKGAKAENPLAENNLADLYLKGEGVPQDDSLAFTWFQKAAAQGNSGARIKLGYMYANGRGTIKNLQTAYVWVKAAEIAGDSRANELLHALEKVLMPTQLEAAREEASRLQRPTTELSAQSFTQ
jgi:TPR repeat protein